MIKLESDSYAILNYKGKPQLCFVLNSKQAVIDNTLNTDEPTQFKFRPEDIVCYLGDKPRVGSVYGIKIEPFVKTIATKTYGPIHLYKELDKRELRSFKTALKSVFSKFEKHASTSFLPLHSTSIRSKKGKYAGSYKPKVKAGEVYDEVEFHPESLSDVEYNEYLIAHEWAHGLWYRCVERRTRSKWIVLFQKRKELSAIDENTISDLARAIIEYGGGLSSYIKEVSDEKEHTQIKEVLNFFKRYHSMSKDDIDLMIEQDSSTLADLWPNQAVVSNTKSDITEYASTKVEEFFAEACAYYFTNRKLPKDIMKALNYTFKRTKAI